MGLRKEYHSKILIILNGLCLLENESLEIMLRK